MEDKPGFWIRRLQQIAVAAFHAEVGADFTPVQYSALSALRARPGVDQATLAGLIAFDRTTLGGVVDRLEARGLLIRRPHPSDRRARALEITVAGVAWLERVEPAVQRAQDLMLRGLAPAERRQFLALLRKAVESGNALSRAPLAAPR